MPIFLPRRWNQQPPYNAGVDWNNPLTRGITFASIGNSSVNALNGTQDARTFAFPTVATTVGLALDPTSTTDRYIVARPTNTQNFAILSVIVPQSVTGLQQIACCDTNLTRVFQFRASDAECQFIRFDTVGFDATNRVVVSVPSAFAIGKPACVIANTRGNTASIWIAGATAAGTIPNTPATWSIADETQSRWFERRAQVIAPNFTTETHGTQHSVFRAIFNRALSDSEARELSVNPWQLFRPAANQTFYSLPSQGTGDLEIAVPSASASATATAPGVFTGAAVDVPAASASATATAPELATGIAVAVPAASPAVSAYAPAIATGVALAVPAASATVSAYAPDVSTASNIELAIPAASVTLTVYPPDVATGVTLSVPATSISAAAYAPAIATGAAIDVPSITVVVGGEAPAIRTGTTIAVPAASATVAAYAPDVATGAITAQEIADAVWDEMMFPTVGGSLPARDVMAGIADYLRARGVNL